MHRIGIISQARMGSSRLPGKILMEIGRKKLLKYHIDRLIWSNIPVYIATTACSRDDEIVAFCKDEGVSCFRGSELDVLSRYYECARYFGIEVIIRVTSDCPFIDGNLIKQGVEKFKDYNNPNLYLSNTIFRTYPRGFDFEIFSLEALQDACLNSELPEEREHVTPYIRNNKSGEIIVENISRKDDASKYRVTVDTVEDFELARRLILEHDCENKTVDEIIKVMELHSDLQNINASVIQKCI